MEFIDEVIKVFMGYIAALSIIQHEPGMIPRFCRMLGDEFFR